MFDKLYGKVDASHQFPYRLTICQNYQFYLNPIYSGNQNFRCKHRTIRNHVIIRVQLELVEPLYRTNYKLYYIII